MGESILLIDADVLAYNAASALSLIVTLVGLAGLGLAARTPKQA